MQQIIDKYSNSSVIKNLDKDNINKTIEFLKNNQCDYIEDLICDYLDLFTIKYEDFVIKYNKLNEKYHNNFLINASQDMNLFEEFFNN